MTSICLMSPFLEAMLSSYAKFIHLLSNLSDLENQSCAFVSSGSPKRTVDSLLEILAII